MARHGYEGASIARIGREAGLTPGLIHYHFTDKLEILLALLDRLEERVAARARARVTGASGARARLDAFAEAWLARGSDADADAVACWVAIAAEALRNVRVRRARERAVRRAIGELEALLRDALVEAGRPPARAAAAAPVVFAAIEGCFLLAASTPGVIPAGAAADVVKRMLDGIVAGADA